MGGDSDRTRCVGAVPGGCADETEAARSFGVSEKGKRGRIGRNRCRGKGASGENRAAARARRRVFPLRLSPRKFAICLRLAENCSDGGAFFIRFRVRCGRPNAHGTSGRKARCSSRRTAGSAGARSELSVSGRRRNDVFPRLGGVRIAPSLRRLAGNDGLRARSLVYGSGPPPPLLPAPPASERTSGRRERSRLRSIAGPPRRKRRRFRGLFLSARGALHLAADSLRRNAGAERDKSVFCRGLSGMSRNVKAAPPERIPAERPRSVERLRCLPRRSPCYRSSTTLTRSSLPPKGGASFETVHFTWRSCPKAA